MLSHIISACPLGKFEDREDHVPKLEQINSTRILSSQNFSLTRKELLSTELLLLEALDLGKWGSILCIFQPLMAASACGCTTPVSASVITLPPLLCYTSLCLPFIRTLVITELPLWFSW